MTNTKHCGAPAIAVYVWPTMQELPVCEEHAPKARGIAAAMGFTLGELPVYPGALCSQHVKVET